MRRRPWLASLGLTAAILLAGSAAYGDPNTGTTSDAADSTTGSTAPPTAPDTGVRPQDSGAVTPPSTTGAGAYNLPAGSVASQIMVQTMKVQSDAEQRKQAQQSITTDQTLINARKENVALAQTAVDTLQAKVNNQASKAYEDQAKVPDKFNPYSSEYNQLNDLEPWLDKGDGYNQGQQDGKDLLAAQKVLNQAQADLQSASDQLTSDQALLKKLTTQYQQDSAYLTTLSSQNANAVAQINAAEAAYDAQFAGQIGTAVDGMSASAKAQAAVRFAEAQLGKPYQWGAQGPDAYDCSGLVMASYQSVGISIPRVADDQYMATSGQSVPISQLLPGDLLFYGTNPGQPTSIYHVAMYVGRGAMIQAPDYGIPVEIVPVAFGQLYGATRVVGATPKPPSKPPTKKPTKPPTKKPSSPPTSGSGTPSSPPSSSSPTPPVTTRPTTAPPPTNTGSGSTSPSSAPSAPSSSASGSEPASASASSSASESASSSASNSASSSPS